MRTRFATIATIFTAVWLVGGKEVEPQLIDPYVQSMSSCDADGDGFPCDVEQLYKSMGDTAAVSGPQAWDRYCLALLELRDRPDVTVPDSHIATIVNSCRSMTYRTSVEKQNWVYNYFGQG